MRRSVGVTDLLCTLMLSMGVTVPTLAVAQIHSTGGVLTAAPVVRDWPVEVWARVGFEPTWFHADGGDSKTLYEVYLTNFSDSPMPLTGIEVHDAAQPKAKALATFTGSALTSMTKILGSSASEKRTAPVIPSGGTAIVFISVNLQGTELPEQLIHRISIGRTATDGARTQVSHAKLLVLDSPLEGKDWVALDGPNEDPENHHRRGASIMDAEVGISRRFAIDWQQQIHGSAFKSDEHNYRAYYCYGRPVLAVADAVVVASRDGMPDNPPGHGDAFHPALPETMDVVPGNAIILDLGGGLYAHYDHLKPGSVKVRAGDRVRPGQLIAQVGASGDAREPHLHFEVTNSITPSKGEGLPYLLRSYTAVQPDGTETRRQRELPTGGMTVKFDEPR